MAEIKIATEVLGNTEPIRKIEKINKGDVILFVNKKYVCVLSDDKLAALCRIQKFDIWPNRTEISYTDSRVVVNEKWNVKDYVLTETIEVK